eukprot:1117272-Prorocentrum_minimum.AAC.1
MVDFAGRVWVKAEAAPTTVFFSRNFSAGVGQGGGGPGDHLGDQRDSQLGVHLREAVRAHGQDPAHPHGQAAANVNPPSVG